MSEADDAVQSDVERLLQRMHHEQLVRAVFRPVTRVERIRAWWWARRAT
jgi:hypothetical protein